MMWNFTQDFLFGLPNSGAPAVASCFNTSAQGFSFFFNEDFGIEGSWMAVVVGAVSCVVVILIGEWLKLNKNKQAD